MNPLSLEAINASAPYEVTEGREENFYEFFTVHDVHYSVGFMEDDILMQEEAYQLIVVNVNHRSSPRDAKVRDTVIGIVDEFFRANNTTLLYICETGDGRQAFRSRLFVRWFNNYAGRDAFVMQTAEVLEGKTRNFAALIVQKSNPRLKEILAEFNETISILTDKPQ